MFTYLDFRGMVLVLETYYDILAPGFLYSKVLQSGAD